MGCIIILFMTTWPFQIAPDALYPPPHCALISYFIYITVFSFPWSNSCHVYLEVLT